MEDTQIIALYLSRQEAAIGETAKKYGGYINRIAYNILRCREDTDEIADKLGLTERNVKYRLSCLRQKLRKQLEREGINV